ncbi:head decoration protein [Cobetia sp. 29-18-1]|uniref:head decoration protein n=1 Tax=Cobetia sp. 29-18-1 TaxID=3040018 RepID=UPI00244AF8DE|nr:head decoration protein [Cobetia sp. 29-18-1]MDH2299834.1 head decoration protein [Cobetia sp. 29-18-1]
MTPIQHTEPARTGEHVLSEAAGSRSRESIVIASGVLAAGTVLAMTADGTYVAHDPTASDGTQIAAGILYGPADAREGPVPAVAHVRDCEVNGTGVTWAADMTDDQLGAMNTALTQAGIILRGVDMPAGVILAGEPAAE